jgi:N-acylneuraminate cytidylyltransferase
MTKIAVIPARGGSKRIPHKNIRDFLGKPAITRTLEKLVESEIFDEVFVSTDSNEIADVATTTKGVKVIFRPANLADDITPTVPVIAHAVTEYKKTMDDLSQQSELDVCCVYPVNPFLDITDMKTGLSTLQTTNGISYVNAIVTYPYPIQRALTMDTVGRIEMINPSLALTRSQDLEETFHDAGQWYWGRAETWLTGQRLLFNSIGVRVPRWRAQDVDTNEDWLIAEKLFRLQ